MQQYFIKGRVENPVIIKDKDTVKHMFNVMRLTEDDQVVLVFEDGIKRLARVTDRENRVFEVIEDLNDNVEMPVSVTIASGFPKGDKLDLVTQKATELGAQAIWAFPADIALGAAEQSKRNCVPEVRLFEKKGEFLSELAHFDKIFIAYEETAKAGELATLARELVQVENGQKILFIFGPEGGISPSEIDAFEEAGGVKIGLGPRIMRTETAPLYALSSVSYALELNK